MAQEKIAIIGGTGDLGFGLGLRWAQAGQSVLIGSRDAKKAQEAAERIRSAVPAATVAGVENAQAAQTQAPSFGSAVFAQAAI
jgi:predicted dinucleotide-binding enzyme